MKTRRMDPITFEVMKNSFRAMTSEATALVIRVAYAPPITEGRDISSALLTSEGRMISHGYVDTAAHFGTFEEKIRTVLREIDDIRPGDTYIMNDPFTGGTHTLDVALIRPIFWDGKLFAFSTIHAHWPDCGGHIPGTFDPVATECYAEGLRIRPIKLYEDDKPVKTVFNIINDNVRTPDERMGDIYAQYYANKLLETRLVDLIRKHGKTNVENGIEELFDYSERIFRKAVDELQEGDYEFEDYGDKDVMHPKQPLIKVHCKLTIKGDRATLDWSESDPAPISSWGFARAALQAANYNGTLICFPFIANLNHGVIRALNIVSKKGTCVDIEEPTANAGYASGAFEKVVHATMGCWMQPLSHVDCNRIHAGTVNLCNCIVGGYNPKTKRRFVSYNWLEGGQGARANKDGPSFKLQLYGSGSSNVSAEILERWYPQMFTHVEAVVDSCGDGKFRGGFAIQRNYTVTAPMSLTIHGDRGEVTPPGLGGGTNGGANRLVLNLGRSDERELGLFAHQVALKAGDHITFLSNGGGGYANPLDRDPESVLSDVMDEFISLEKARDVYGVVIKVIDKEALLYEIDQKATEKMRGELGKKRLPVGLGPGQVHPFGQKIICRAHSN